MFEELFQSDPSAEAYTERQRAEERMRLMQQERARNDALVQQMIGDRSVNTGGIDVSAFKADELQQIKDEILRNRKMREEAITKLKEIAFKDPIEAAKELKAKQRQGGNKVANFFRNIDYAVQGYGDRDQEVARDRSKDAATKLLMALTSQDSSLRNSISDQNKIAQKFAELDNKKGVAGLKATTDMARNQTSSDIAATKAIQSGQMTDNNTARTQSEILKNKALTDRITLGNTFYAPPNVGQDVARAAMIENLRKNGMGELADKIKAGGEGSAMLRSFLSAASKHTGPRTTTSTTSYRDKDALGNTVEIQGLPRTSVSSQGRSPILDILGPALQQRMPEVLQRLKSSPNMAGGPQAGNQVAQDVVRKAFDRATSEGARRDIAAEAITKGLPKEQIAEDERLRRLNRNFVIDWNPNAPKGRPGTGGSAEQQKRRDLETKIQTNVDTGAKMLMEASATGLLDKVMGMDQGFGGRLIKGASAMAPQSIKNWLIPSSDDPDYAFRRMFPGWGQDEDSARFRTQFKSFMDALGFDIQKDATGLQALGQEMDRIKSQMPQITDDPTVALTAMLNLAITKKIEGSLLRKGYDSPQVIELMGIAGDYVTPRLIGLVEKVKAAKSDYANGKIKNRAEVAKRFDLNDLSPDEILGAAIEEKGIPLENLPIKMRRLVPKKPSLESQFPGMQWPKEKEKDYPRLRR